MRRQLHDGAQKGTKLRLQNYANDEFHNYNLQELPQQNQGNAHQELNEIINTAVNQAVDLADIDAVIDAAFAARSWIQWSGAEVKALQAELEQRIYKKLYNNAESSIEAVCQRQALIGKLLKLANQRLHNISDAQYQQLCSDLKIESLPDSIRDKAERIITQAISLQKISDAFTTIIDNQGAALNDHDEAKIIKAIESSAKFVEYTQLINNTYKNAEALYNLSSELLSEVVSDLHTASHKAHNSILEQLKLQHLPELSQGKANSAIESAIQTAQPELATAIINQLVNKSSFEDMAVSFNAKGQVKTKVIDSKVYKSTKGAIKKIWDDTKSRCDLANELEVSVTESLYSFADAEIKNVTEHLGINALPHSIQQDINQNVISTINSINPELRKILDAAVVMFNAFEDAKAKADLKHSILAKDTKLYQNAISLTAKKICAEYEQRYQGMFHKLQEQAVKYLRGIANAEVAKVINELNIKSFPLALQQEINQIINGAINKQNTVDAISATVHAVLNTSYGASDKELEQALFNSVKEQQTLKSVIKTFNEVSVNTKTRYNLRNALLHETINNLHAEAAAKKQQIFKELAIDSLPQALQQEADSIINKAVNGVAANDVLAAFIDQQCANFSNWNDANKVSELKTKALKDIASQSVFTEHQTLIKNTYANAKTRYNLRNALLHEAINNLHAEAAAKKQQIFKELAIDSLPQALQQEANSIINSAIDNTATADSLLVIIDQKCANFNNWSDANKVAELKTAVLNAITSNSAFIEHQTLIKNTYIDAKTRYNLRSELLKDIDTQARNLVAIQREQTFAALSVDHLPEVIQQKVDKVINSALHDPAIIETFTVIIDNSCANFNSWTNAAKVAELKTAVISAIESSAEFKTREALIKGTFTEAQAHYQFRQQELNRAKQSLAAYNAEQQEAYQIAELPESKRSEFVSKVTKIIEAQDVTEAILSVIDQTCKGFTQWNEEAAIAKLSKKVIQQIADHAVIKENKSLIHDTYDKAHYCHVRALKMVAAFKEGYDYAIYSDDDAEYFEYFKQADTQYQKNLALHQQHKAISARLDQLIDDCKLQAKEQLTTVAQILHLDRMQGAIDAATDYVTSYLKSFKDQMLTGHKWGNIEANEQFFASVKHEMQSAELPKALLNIVNIEHDLSAARGIAERAEFKNALSDEHAKQVAMFHQELAVASKNHISTITIMGTAVPISKDGAILGHSPIDFYFSLQDLISQNKSEVSQDDVIISVEPESTNAPIAGAVAISNDINSSLGLYTSTTKHDQYINSAFKANLAKSRSPRVFRY